MIEEAAQGQKKEGGGYGNFDFDVVLRFFPEMKADFEEICLYGEATKAEFLSSIQRGISPLEIKALNSKIISSHLENIFGNAPELISTARTYIRKFGDNSAKELSDLARLVGNSFTPNELTLILNRKIGIPNTVAAAESEVVAQATLIIDNLDFSVTVPETENKSNEAFSVNFGKKVENTNDTNQPDIKMPQEVHLASNMLDVTVPSSNSRIYPEFVVPVIATSSNSVALNLAPNESAKTNKEALLSFSDNKPMQYRRSFFQVFLRFVLFSFATIFIGVVSLGFFSQPIGAWLTLDRGIVLEKSLAAIFKIIKIVSPQFAPQPMDVEAANELNKILNEQYDKCWFDINGSYPDSYVPEVTVEYAENGKIVGQPQVLNLPKTTKELGLANIAIKAVSRCNPIQIPSEYRKFYRDWRKQTVRFQSN